MLTIDLFEELEGPPEPTLIDALRDFLPIAVEHLELKKLPKIKLVDEIETDHMPSFGKFSNDDRTVHLGIKNRHPNDVLRTLAHEMVHYAQGCRDELDSDSGATGSSEEDQANAEAGVIMREFNEQFPQYMELKPIMLEKWSKKYKKSINCSNPKGFSQKAHCAGRKKHTNEAEDVAEGSEQSLSSMVRQDQAERNEYANFVKSQAGGDWIKGAKMYAQLKKRPSNDIFGDATRLNQFMKMKFNFDKFTDEDWDNYWLLAQHCDDHREFQKNALSIIKKYQGTDHSHYKYLSDRISVGLTGKQKYGTQNIIGQQGVAESANKECPPATQDITLNLKNRQKAINEYGYGPLNPDLPNTKFWMKKVDEWNLDSAEEAKSSLCGNCAAFDQREDTLDCIAQGIGSEQGADDPTIDAGDLGYCRFLKFKCASKRTCDAWVTGGPLTEGKHCDAKNAVPELKAALTKRKSELKNADAKVAYDKIDKIMTRIANTYKISGQKLHDLWTERYGEIPDTWVLDENFADGKGPGKPGDSQRHGIPKGATMAQLEKASHSAGRKGQLARWQLNMRNGRKK